MWNLEKVISCVSNVSSTVHLVPHFCHFSGLGIALWNLINLQVVLEGATLYNITHHYCLSVAVGVVVVFNERYILENTHRKFEET